MSTTTERLAVDISVCIQQVGMMVHVQSTMRCGIVKSIDTVIMLTYNFNVTTNKRFRERAFSMTELMRNAT